MRCRTILAASVAATALALAACPVSATGVKNRASSIADDVEEVAPDPQEQSRSAGASTGVEDIIVTAQKREQILVDVPQAISVIGGETLERQHATTFQDYLKLVPGLQLNQDTPGQGRLVIRGLNTGGVASTVAVYLDETPFGSSSGLVNGAVLAGDFDAFDVARVEVLRGPQGTLYGASSLGGVLKFVSNAPSTDEIEARGRAGVEFTRGGKASYYGNAVLNLPISDTLALRGSGFYRKLGGFIDSTGIAGSRTRNDINNAEIYGGRASLLFRPSNSISVRLDALLQNLDTDAPTVVESDPNTLRTLYGRPTQSIFVTPRRDVRYRVYDGTIDLDLGFGKLTSVSSYSTQKQPSRSDQTLQLSALIQQIFGVANEAYLGQNTDLERYTQELRVASDGSGFVDWVVGGFYSHEKGLINQQYFIVDPGTLTEIAAVPLLARVDLRSRFDEIAGFANLTFHLGDRFDIDIGGRESHNSQRSMQSTAGLLIGVAQLAARSTDDVFTWSVAPKYKLGRRASIYARVAKGYRPGGPNALAPGAPAGSETYSADTVINYEVGVKAETDDRILSFDIAAYRIDWRDIQLITQTGSGSSSFSFNINASDARSEGLEFTTTVRPATGFSVALNGAYNNAELRDDAPAVIGARAGDQLPFTPRYSLGVNTDYEWIPFGDTRAYVGASLRALSKQTAAYDAAYRAANGRQREVPAYDVVDLRAGLDFGRLSLDAYLKNLTDADGKLSTTTLGLYPAGAIGTGVIRPRTFGTSLTLEF